MQNVASSTASFGLVLRAFARTADKIEEKAGEVADAINLALGVSLDGKPWFQKILVLVPMDTRYEQCDVGGTADAIRRLVDADDRMRSVVTVEEFHRGDNFCGTLNYAVAQMLHEGIDHVTVLSAEARTHLDTDVAHQTRDALASGAKVVGVVIEKLVDSIREGRVANTFATWDAKALVAAGGFDLLAAQVPHGDEEANSLRGVEEIIPLLRLVDAHGACIAIVEPAGSSEWAASGKAHDKKLDSKLLRQTLRAQQIGGKLSTLKASIFETPVDR